MIFPKTNTNKKHKILSNIEYKQMWWGYLFVLPTIVGMIFLNVIPEIQTILYSFTKVTGLKRDNIKWIGLENYKDMMSDPIFWQAFKNIFVFAILAVPLTVVFSVILGILLNQKIKGKSIYRTVAFMPVVVPPVALGLIWTILFEPTFGVINSMIGKEIRWLTNPTLGMIAMVAVSVWASIGYYALLVLAGLQSIPSTYYEAATIDGANVFQVFLKIVVPLLTPIIFLIAILTTISSLQLFDLAVVLIGRYNPAYYELRPVLEFFYQYAFASGKYGYASVSIVLLLFVIGIITLFQFKLQTKWVNYE